MFPSGENHLILSLEFSFLLMRHARAAMKLKDHPSYKQLLAELRVLIIDDFEMGRTMLRNALTAIGLPTQNMIEACNGREAVDKLARGHERGASYGLVLSDWLMPEMTGIELLKFCREDERFSKTPIIMVTSEADPESVLKAMKMGANDYITKPATPEDLERKITKIFAKQVKNS